MTPANKTCFKLYNCDRLWNKRALIGGRGRRGLSDVTCFGGGGRTYPRQRTDFRTTSAESNPRSRACPWCRWGTRWSRLCPPFPTRTSGASSPVPCGAPPGICKRCPTFFETKRLTVPSPELTCIASLFNCAFLLTDSMSPTAKPMRRFISRIGISTMNRTSMNSAGVGYGSTTLSSFP